MWMRSSLFLLIPRCQFNYNALEIAFLLTGLTSFLLNERGTREMKKRERESGWRKLFWGRVANSKMFISKVNDILKWHKLIISANERGRERERERDKARKRQWQQVEWRRHRLKGRWREKEREWGVVERALSVLKQSAFYFNLLI